MSERPNDKTCTATNSNGESCNAWRVEGSDKCYHHMGTSKDGSSHEDNDNAVKHGAFKEHFRSDLEPEEQDAIDDMVQSLREINDERGIPAEVAAEALMKYKRSADSRFLREARQWFSEFNLLPNSDTMELTGEGGGGIIIQTESDGGE